jgi:sialate O-acetylesterase
VVPLFCAVVLGQQGLKLNTLFSDGVILQEHASDPIYGTAGPNAQVQLTLGAQIYSTHADGRGNWQIAVPIGGAGPAFSFEVASGSDRATVRNARAGEVWLASGQSNMEFMEIQADDYDQAKKQADPNVCMFIVKKATAESPHHDLQGAWESSSPNNVSHFSAVGLAFARELSNRLEVPVGIIDASWGGTPAEAWIAADTLQKDAATRAIYDKFLSDLKVYDSRQSAYKVAMDMWTTGKNGSDNQGFQNNWMIDAFSDAGWQSVPAGEDSQDILKRDFEGSVWYRKTVTLPDNWSGQRLKLQLGEISGMDATYFNGVRAGYTTLTTSDPNRPREYTISPGMVHKGPNLIAIRIFNPDSPVGMKGPPDDMRLMLEDETSYLPLNGDWKFNVEQELDPDEPRPHLPNGPGNPTSPAELYNGMIAPLIPFRIKGAIWYQGESNVGGSALYVHLFTDLIQDWRKRWGEGNFPFYYVQLANYLAKQTAPEESAWANLREAQAKAQGLPNTGMAVTIDLGEVGSIHPKNKREVGKRLALWALGLTYRTPTPYASPCFKSMEIRDSRVIVDFSNGSLTTTDGKAPTGFSVAGADHKFYFAEAAVVGSTVTVSAPEVLHPVAVRYAWADNPTVNLVNLLGLPAAPFRSDDWSLTEVTN